MSGSRVRAKLRGRSENRGQGRGKGPNRGQDRGLDGEEGGGPSREVQRGSGGGQDRGPCGEEGRGPSKKPVKEPSREVEIGSGVGKDRGPCGEEGRGPSKEPVKEPSRKVKRGSGVAHDRGPCGDEGRGPSKEPVKTPSRKVERGSAVAHDRGPCGEGGGPSKKPVKKPSRKVERGSGGGQDRGPCGEEGRGPSKEPVKEPSRKVKRGSGVAQDRRPCGEEGRGPSKKPVKEPSREVERGSGGGKDRGPCGEEGRGPSKEPVKEPSRKVKRGSGVAHDRGPCGEEGRGPSKEPVKEPSRKVERGSAVAHDRGPCGEGGGPSKKTVKKPSRKVERGSGGGQDRGPCGEEGRGPSKEPVKEPSRKVKRGSGVAQDRRPCGEEGRGPSRWGCRGPTGGVNKGLDDVTRRIAGKKRNIKLLTDELKGTAKNSPDEIALNFKKEPLCFVFEEQQLTKYQVKLIAGCLSRACDCEKQDCLLELLSKLPESCLITQHIGPLLNKLATVQSESLQSSDITAISDIEKLMTTTLRKLPNCYANLPLPQLYLAAVTHVGSEQVTDIRLMDRVQSLMEIRKQKIEEIKEEEERKKEEKKRKWLVRKALASDLEEGDPPEPIRYISVAPTEVDILTHQKPFFRENKLDGPYKDPMHYLDVQFRLLREDFVRPLREGIQQLLVTRGRNTADAPQDIRVYNDVKILGETYTTNGVVYEIKFDTSRLRHIQWENSKRLIYGSLLCLSEDDFESFVFATVEDGHRDLVRKGCVTVKFITYYGEAKRPSDVCKMVESTAFYEAYRHVLEGLKQMYDGNLPLQRYIVECAKDVRPPAYLQNGQGQFDFIPIMKHNKTRGLLRRRSNTVQVLNPASWPSAETLGLDESQLKALELALTKELAIIQGPPGTGKTFIGLMIAEVLLHNVKRFQSWPRTFGPVLVVCFTNHALDQFLEGIHEFHPHGIVRVGRRSESEVMQECSLREIKQKRIKEKLNSRSSRRAFAEAREIMEKYAEKIEKTIQLFQDCSNHVLNELVVKRFAESMTSDQYNSIKNGHPKEHDRQLHSAIECWLQVTVDSFELQQGKEEEKQETKHEDQGGNSNLNENEKQDGYQTQIDINFQGDVIREQRILDTDDVITFQKSLPDKSIEVTQNCATKETEEEAESGEWEYQHLKQVKRRIKRVIKRELSRKDTMEREQAMKVKDVWSLEIADRWRLYRLWIEDMASQFNRRIPSLWQMFDDQVKHLKSLKEQEELEILRQADVIGMTTTGSINSRSTSLINSPICGACSCPGAARYHTLLQRIRPKITIVEEAAEVLEAHIVTSLTEGCEHLILIGDHQQLRPNPTVYTLAKYFKLDVSLFERLVKNDLPFARLRLQHRMRPEIAELLEDIYTEPKLENHETVFNFENIGGVEHNVFFLNHAEMEDSVEEGKSKSNIHEAKFLLALCRYLIQQGYTRDQITILTAYVGQLTKFKKEMSTKEKFFDGIRVTAVDNFQGEENDIILLSLVRSNDQDKIGFLNIENRVCVALSRARKGFFCIGNVSLLARKSPLWRSIIERMQSHGKTGDAMKLLCQNHPDTVIDASSVEDFKRAPDGGCYRLCNTRLKCGHVCRMFCHPIDPEHSEYQCKKPCEKTRCPLKHNRCQKMCWEECDPCMVLVEKIILNCNHIHSVPCSMDVSEENCLLPRETFQLCDHHKKSASRLNVPSRPCREPCTDVLKCKHPCSGDCYSCLQRRVHVPCGRRCDRILFCGHKCRKWCTQRCNPCTQNCRNYCQHKKCEMKCNESCQPCSEKCPWACPHMKCTKSCAEMCDRERCNEPCPKTLSCEHSCIGLCGEKCPSVCRECNKAQFKKIAKKSHLNARFVELDCQHVFDVDFLDRWMDGDDNSEDTVIQLKRCPVCKIPIVHSLRYGNVIKKILADIESIKRRIALSVRDQEKSKAKLQERLNKLHMFPAAKLPTSCHQIYTDEEITILEIQVTFLEFLRTLETTIQEGMETESEGICSPQSQSILDTTQTFLDSRIGQLKERLVKIPPNADISVSLSSNQELEELNEEIFRTRLLASFKILKMQLRLREIRLGVTDTVMLGFVQEALDSKKSIGLIKLRRYMNRLERLRNGHGLKPFCQGDENKAEESLFVKAMDIKQGNWFKCPRDHLYSIPECDNTEEEDRPTCPRCVPT